LLGACKRVDGRKKLQKIVHILREAGYPFAYRYGYHFHGPFSDELKADIDALASENLVNEQECGTTFGGFKQYTYSLSDSARSLIESLGATGLPSWSDLAEELNEKPAQELESISTIIYLMRSGCAEPQLRTRFGQLKPHLAGYFDNASAFAQRVTNLKPHQMA
jgi:uncharacterized protein YwgA